MEGRAPKKKILVVDDDRDLVELLDIKLSKSGYDVLTSTDGKSGIEAARRFRPDLVIVDLMMPGVHGYDVCETLSNDAEIGKPKVVIMSAKSFPSDKAQAKRVGALHYLEKPFEMDELIRCVRSFLPDSVI